MLAALRRTDHVDERCRSGEAGDRSAQPGSPRRCVDGVALRVEARPRGIRVVRERPNGTHVQEQRQPRLVDRPQEGIPDLLMAEGNGNGKLTMKDFKTD